MNWVALVVATGLAAATAGHHDKHHRVPSAQRQAKRPPAHKGVLRPRTAAPPGTPVPLPNPGPTATATPAPTATATPPALYAAAGVDVQDTPDYSLVPTHTQFRAGSVTFNGQNFGMDPHNLTIRPDGGQPIDSVALPADMGAESRALTVTLTSGSYVLYCSLPGHEAAGMHFAITVRSG